MFAVHTAASRTGSNQKQPLLWVWVVSSNPGWNPVTTLHCIITLLWNSEFFGHRVLVYVLWTNKFSGKKSVHTLGWCLRGKKKIWVIEFFKLNQAAGFFFLHPVDTHIWSTRTCPKLRLGHRVVWKLYGGSVITAGDMPMARGTGSLHISVEWFLVYQATLSLLNGRIVFSSEIFMCDLSTQHGYV